MADAAGFASRPAGAMRLVLQPVAFGIDVFVQCPDSPFVPRERYLDCRDARTGLRRIHAELVVFILLGRGYRALLHRGDFIFEKNYPLAQRGSLFFESLFELRQLVPIKLVLRIVLGRHPFTNGAIEDGDFGKHRQRVGDGKRESEAQGQTPGRARHGQNTLDDRRAPVDIPCVSQKRDREPIELEQGAIEHRQHRRDDEGDEHAREYFGKEVADRIECQSEQEHEIEDERKSKLRSPDAVRIWTVLQNNGIYTGNPAE